MDRKGIIIMEQILINYTKDDEGKIQLVVSSLNADGTRISQTPKANNLTPNDIKFVEALELLVKTYCK